MNPDCERFVLWVQTIEEEDDDDESRGMYQTITHWYVLGWKKVV